MPNIDSVHMQITGPKRPGVILRDYSGNIIVLCIKEIESVNDDGRVKRRVQIQDRWDAIALGLLAAPAIDLKPLLDLTKLAYDRDTTGFNVLDWIDSGIHDLGKQDHL